jgi:hypothetical protein
MALQNNYYTGDLEMSSVEIVEKAKKILLF